MTKNRLTLLAAAISCTAILCSLVVPTVTQTALLSTAALHGQLDIAKYLLDRKANVKATNNDGNTPLHVAAFLCRAEIVQLLLENGGTPLTKNNRGETAIDVVSSPWSQPLADFYTAIAKDSGFELDLKRIEQQRPQIAELLRENAMKSETSNDKPKETGQ